MKIKGELDTGERISLLSKIDWGFWKEQNPYFSDDPLNKSMRAALTLMKSRGFLGDFDPEKASDYSCKIREEIGSFNMKSPNYDKLSFIFDLIQAWGGQTGRSPYVIPKGGVESGRDRFSDWKSFYFQGSKFAMQDSPVESLVFFRKIPGLGASFSPKHLMFWSNKYPVLDTRISLLLCGTNRLLRKPEDYGTFLNLMDPLAKSFNNNLLDVERALFAFSQNFFFNGKIEFTKTAPLVKKDLHIAEQIAGVRIS